VKLYADDPDSQLVRGLTDIVVSAIARVEVPAAIWRKHRIGELDVASARTLLVAFEVDLLGTNEKDPRFVIAVLSRETLGAAARLTGVHNLRAYDAVQLSSAMSARAADHEIDSFVCFDETLRSAAGTEGFDVVPS
jgi:predicted nucleic acid-binding protein